MRLCTADPLPKPDSFVVVWHVSCPTLSCSVTRNLDPVRRGHLDLIGTAVIFFFFFRYFPIGLFKGSCSIPGFGIWDLGWGQISVVHAPLPS